MGRGRRKEEKFLFCTSLLTARVAFSFSHISSMHKLDGLWDSVSLL